jgi:hypothetical protein
LSEAPGSEQALANEEGGGKVVVRLDAAPDEVRAYLSEQADRGIDHVRAVVRGDRDTMVTLIDDLDEDEAAFKPDEDEFSVRDVVEHLNLSFARSEARLRSLARDEVFVWLGAPGRWGGLPDEPAPSWAAAREAFIAGEAAVLGVLDSLEGEAPARTAEHAELGPLNLLQWALYSHHLHTRDHIGQVRALRAQIEAQRRA